MQKFNLNAAQMGKPLVTRDGRPAIYVAVLKKSNPEFPLLVEVLQNPLESKKNQSWKTENLTLEGEYLGFIENENDLFLAAEDHQQAPVNTNENQLEIFNTNNND